MEGNGWMRGNHGVVGMYGKEVGFVVFLFLCIPTTTGVSTLPQTRPVGLKGGLRYVLITDE